VERQDGDKTGQAALNLSVKVRRGGFLRPETIFSGSGVRSGSTKYPVPRIVPNSPRHVKPQRIRYRDPSRDPAPTIDQPNDKVNRLAHTLTLACHRSSCWFAREGAMAGKTLPPAHPVGSAAAAVGRRRSSQDARRKQCIDSVEAVLHAFKTQHEQRWGRWGMGEGEATKSAARLST
jgi:hypothetical protein